MDIATYCAEHTNQPDEALYEVYRSVMLHTANPGMASTPYQGRLLQMLAALTQPDVAVEVGSHAGYGAVCIARGMNQGATLHVIEIEEEYADTILHHADMAGVRDRVALHIGDAASLIPTLPDGIGLAFVDADKEQYETYYRLLLPKMKNGGLLIFDNMLWYGRVLDTAPESHSRVDRDTLALQRLADHITRDPLVDNILLPVRDGLMLCRKK